MNTDKFTTIDEEYQSLLNIFAQPNISINYDKEKGFDISIKPATQLQSIDELEYAVYLITKVKFYKVGDIFDEYSLAYKLSTDEIEVRYIETDRLDSIIIDIDKKSYDRSLGDMLKTTAIWLDPRMKLYNLINKVDLKDGIYEEGNWFSDSELFGIYVKARVKVDEHDKDGNVTKSYTIPNNSGINIVETIPEQTDYDKLIIKDEAYTTEQKMVTLYGDLSRQRFKDKINSLITEESIQNTANLGVYDSMNHKVEKDFRNSRGVSGRW